MKNTFLFKTLLLISVSFLITSCSVLGLSSSNSSEEISGSTESNIPLAGDGSSGELRDINFSYNSTALDMESKAVLRDNSQWLAENSSVSIRVEGHCDERGTSEFNLALGQRRAQIVKDYLTISGIDASRISIQSYGEEIPLVDNSDEEAWAQNRRVHFKIEN